MNPVEANTTGVDCRKIDNRITVGVCDDEETTHEEGNEEEKG